MSFEVTVAIVHSDDVAMSERGYKVATDSVGPYHCL